ncbi:hypothetical protein BPOR_0266g00110 [Botrytis porri]|uniref:UBC core domain-containing protein n=1 Tax=Botrytis porri TaxID=87229 RepID=A0A4Z1KNA2_9HELO|nr:hypothetical protein BPOR_0266g00110 [Botrytis porri]
MSKRRLSNASSDSLALEGEARSRRLRTASPQRTRVTINFDDQPLTKLIIPVTSATTIDDLQSLIFNPTAKSRVFGAAGDEVTPAPGFNIGLWFKNTDDDSSVWALGTDTPEKLCLTGSLENPLNIFLVLISEANFRPHLIPCLLERMMLVTNIGEAKNCLESSLRMMVVPKEKKTILFKPVKGKRMPIPATDDFRNIINVCNSSQHFRMLSPLQLDGRENSGISLSKAGYVSHYTQKGDETSQSRLENAITGFETLPSRPGQSLLQALRSVVSQRQIEGTWEIDDWERVESSSPVINPSSGPDEAIVICLDKSISMRTSLGNNWIGNGQINTLNRFDEAKQVFRNVVSRLSAYHLNVHIGLVTFGSKAEQEAQISPVGKEFKNKLENTQATDHRTSLFDALSVARSRLVSHQKQYTESKMKLRIIALTDGKDNSSVFTAEETREMLYNDDIVLDSIVIGGSSSDELFKISKYTGGYAFKPTSRMLLFQTFLLEPFLDILARPDIVKIPLDDYDTSLPKEADMTTIDDFPPCRPHQLQDGGFVSLDAATRQLAGKSSSLLEICRMSASAEPAHRSTGRLFLDEMRLMIANPHASMDIYVSEVDMAFWKIVMSGPASTAYSEGTFALFVHMTDTYPQKSPAVRFITPVLHPNVSKHGRICHEIFDDGWKSSFHIHDILKTVFTLFENPKASCDAAIDELATLKFWTDRETADAEIKKYVTKFATRTRLQWKREMDLTV